MNAVPLAVLAAAAVAVYAYAGYPLLLALLARARPRRRAHVLHEWPRISVSVPAYNEERQIAAALDAILATDYPPGLRQVVVVSDASTDGTDAIVRGYADQGVVLVRMPERGGKTAAENAAAPFLTGEIVVNTDASVRVAPGALMALVQALADPAVGVASGRDVSVAAPAANANAGESGYVGYEMDVRRLESRMGGIVGASGCLYAIRARLHRLPLPEGLSRDFAAVLLARRAGFRAVSVEAAVCTVPRAGSLRAEYRRKVRTMSRGMRTLAHLRELLNPIRHGAFAWMLASHKVARWLVPWALALAFSAVVAQAPDQPWAMWIAAAGGVLLANAGLALALPSERLPRAMAIPAYVVLGNLAAIDAGIRAVAGRGYAVWEPTRREAVA
ncbi:MAG TPA: glycosyltransferase [Longimicrobiaceae bacterium]|jgi:cellulose synthase/poly-beta-1,6-N-acetylglucosamine synthase-like glycosyltransferase|nr:glycosyltransferase [Longimicrobiaceae bacterium]